MDLELATTCRVYQGDCLSILRDFEDNSFDLVLTSPPYENVRSYGDLKFKLQGQDWVDWAVERYLECVRVSRGLVAWVVEGKTRKFQWSATPALLMADLHRAGVKLRKPPAFQRKGIPGSGGPDWLKNDYELIVCSSKGRLPWSDNTVMGHPPKFPPGGNPSHQSRDGRVNGPRLQREVNDQKRVRTYKPPSRANPGNVIKCDDSVSMDVIDLLEQYERKAQANPCEILRDMWQAVGNKEIPQWIARVYSRTHEAEILQSYMSRGGIQPAGWSEAGRASASGEENSKEEEGSGQVREVWKGRATGDSPQRPGCHKQRNVQPSCPMSSVSQKGAQDGAVLDSWLRQEILRSGVLLNALPEVQEVWESIHQEIESKRPTSDSGDVIHCKVGGGHMGNKISMENEAPFPEKLAEFFIRSFCPEGGTVLDPFAGSGTTLAVAKKFGRNAIGIDIRPCQVDLTHRRIAEIG